MGYYAIGIGGTGAKCLESLIHLAAAGMMPEENSELYMLFVDPDAANGCLERAVATLNRYKTFSNNPQLEQSCLLQTKIRSADRTFWTPFKDDAQPRLSDFYGYNTLLRAKDTTADLFQVLYSTKERTTTLDKGFRGHPSIGASVMAQTVKLGEDDPWLTFRTLVAKDTDAKVFLAGSIFGGTGASGFPTIAALVKDELKGKKVQIGGALVLPYFTFTDIGDNELKAKAEHFLMNTQAALKYYHLWNKKLIYDAIYLFGDESRVEVENSLGGPEQQNASHFIELYAALAAVDFFGRDFGPDAVPQYFMTAREQGNQLKWTDLPDEQKGNKIRSKIRQLAHFAFAYLSIYQPMLEDIRKKGRNYRAPWYIDFFKRNGISLDNNQTQTSLKDIQDYCKDFLIWLANIQNSVGNTELVKYETYAQKTDGNRLKLKSPDSFVLEEFGNLISPYHQKESSLYPVNKLWKDMCLAKGKGDGTGDIGRFLATLYQNCEKI